jgi:hypothetical protein
MVVFCLLAEIVPLQKLQKQQNTPGRRLKTYATYDRPHLLPKQFNFFGDPILFAICTSKIINQ